MRAVQLGLHKDFTSSIIVTPWGMVDPAEATAGHDIPLNSGTNVKQNHALLLLSRALTASGVSSAEHVTIMTKGFTAATGECPPVRNVIMRESSSMYRMLILFLGTGEPCTYRILFL